MAREPELVTIVNANGRKGRVAPSYPPLVKGLIRRAPSELANTSGADEVPVELTMPARNASTETWREYARSRPDSGLSSDEVDAYTRDEFVAHFIEEN